MRRPLLAGLLSLLVTGLGDAYNGFAGQGARLLVFRLAALAVIAAAWSVIAAMGRTDAVGPLGLLFIGTGVGVQLYAAVRAWRDARRRRALPPPPHRLRACLAYFVLGSLVLLLGAWAIRTFAVQAFKVPSGAMMPTLLIGDHILVSKLDYGARVETPFGSSPVRRLFGLRRPQPGDVIVFIWPKDRSKDFVKRVVAVGGETIEVRDQRVLVDGKPRDDPHATWVNRGQGLGDPYGPYTVPPEHVFVLGDNRMQSYDSRFWGPVPLADVKGRVVEVYWSWGERGTVRWERVGRVVE